MEFLIFLMLKWILPNIVNWLISMLGLTSPATLNIWAVNTFHFPQFLEKQHDLSVQCISKEEMNKCPFLLIFPWPTKSTSENLPASRLNPVTVELKYTLRSGVTFYFNFTTVPLDGKNPLVLLLHSLVACGMCVEEWNLVILN